MYNNKYVTIKEQSALNEMPKSKSISHLLWFIIYIFLAVRMSPDLLAKSQLWQLVFAVYVFCCLMHIITQKIYKNKVFLFWYLTFFVWAFLSFNWALNKSDAYTGINIHIVIVIAFGLLSFIIQNIKDIYALIKIIMLSIFSCFINMLINLQWDKLFTERLGYDNINNNWNANDLGDKLVLFVLLSIFLYFNHQIKKKKTIFILDLIFLFFAFLTGSRKTIIGLVLFIFLYIAFKQRGKVMYRIFIGVILIGVFYFLLMNLPPLYNVIGYRFDGLISGNSTEGSYIGRSNMINMGLIWFVEKPFFGYGLNNFRSMSYYGTYSHCNYIELMVNLGIVGLILFYSIYIYLLKKATRIKKYKSFIFATVLSGFVLDIGRVSYTSITWNLMLFLCIALVQIEYKKDKL